MFAATQGKEVVTILQKLGFGWSEPVGVTFFLNHPAGWVTTVPVHSGEVIGHGLLRAILRDIEMTADEFLEHS